MARSEVCRICGQPRAPHSPMALCEEHQREYWREKTRNKRRGAKQPKSKPAAPPVIVVGEGALPLESARKRVTVTGDQVTLHIEVFRWMVAAMAKAKRESAPATAFTRRLAVVAGDLERVLVYEARPVELHPLAAGTERYAQQMQALREAGFIICVEE